MLEFFEPEVLGSFLRYGSWENWVLCVYERTKTKAIPCVQLEYAALDAAVLVHIFHHIRGHSQPATAPEGHEKIEWKSYIVSTASLMFYQSLILQRICVYTVQK